MTQSLHERGKEIARLNKLQMAVHLAGSPAGKQRASVAFHAEINTMMGIIRHLESLTQPPSQAVIERVALAISGAPFPSSSSLSKAKKAIAEYQHAVGEGI